MARYLLQHRHRPRECGVVFASFKSHASPLRHRATVDSCRSGRHAIWWTNSGLFTVLTPESAHERAK